MKAKKLLLLGASAILTATGLAGCGGTSTDEPVDDTKTQINLKYTNGGFGSAWLDKLSDEFEEAFKNYSFEEGKKGVQIIPDYDKRNTGYEQIRGNSNQIYIQEDSDYITFVNKGVVRDLTDVVNDYAITGVDANGNFVKETNTKIVDKIKDGYKPVYNVNDKYYGIPLFETNVGLQYNVKVFEDSKLFFKEGMSADDFTEADFNNPDKLYSLFITRATDTRSKGPDGKTGKEGNINYSADDGLPATYKDFRALLEMMKISGVTPFIWNSTCSNYLTSLINDMWATNTGVDQFNLNLKFEGEATDLVKIENNQVVFTEKGEPVTETVQITSDNRVELQRQKGKLQALEFAKYLVGEGNFYKQSWNTAYTDAQNYFINPDKYSVGKIGFIVEGGWWFNEATDFFTPGTQHDAKFSPYVLPKADKSLIGTPNVRVSDRRSFMFISNYVSENSVKALNTFMSFLQSDHALETYTALSGGMRAMKYEISDTAFDSLPYYTQRAWEIANRTSTVTLPWLPLTKAAQEKVLELDYAKYGFALDANDGNPVKFFYEWDKGGTPKTKEEYFVDIYNFKSLTK